MTLLALDRVSIGFSSYDGLLQRRERTALEQVTLAVDRGEIVALIGASGAGKSLLAHALFGILPPNASVGGRLRFDGAPLDAAAQARYCGRRMALVPQSVTHLDPLTRCGRQLRWAAQRAGRLPDARPLAHVLERYGLDEAAARAFPHQLSGGMARRMMLAIATVGDPDLIVADEPTGGLDPHNADIVLRHLRHLADAGKAILLITHSLAEALPFADRVPLLRDGRLVATEPASGFTGDGSALSSSYARALWQALPQNGFVAGEPVDA